MCSYQDDHEMIYDIGVYVFINKNRLKTLLYENEKIELIKNRICISNPIVDKTPYINLNKFRLDERIDIRNKILKESSILVQKPNYSDGYQNGIISIYPCISDYYSSNFVNNKTNLALLSLDENINQSKLDEVCLSIIDMADDENRTFRNSSIQLLNNMKQKILNLKALTDEEEKILNMLLNEEKNRIRKNNDILSYTLKRVRRK